MRPGNVPHAPRQCTPRHLQAQRRRSPGQRLALFCKAGAAPAAAAPPWDRPLARPGSPAAAEQHDIGLSGVQFEHMDACVCQRHVPDQSCPTYGVGFSQCRQQQLHTEANTRSGYRGCSTAASSPSSRSPFTNATCDDVLRFDLRFTRMPPVSQTVQAMPAQWMITALTAAAGESRPSLACKAAHNQKHRPHISFSTIEMGVRPGFTMETFRNSLPRSTANTAACAVLMNAVHASNSTSNADGAARLLAHRWALCCLLMLK